MGPLGETTSLDPLKMMQEPTNNDPPLSSTIRYNITTKSVSIHPGSTLTVKKPRATEPRKMYGLFQSPTTSLVHWETLPLKLDALAVVTAARDTGLYKGSLLKATLLQNEVTPPGFKNLITEAIVNDKVLNRQTFTSVTPTRVNPTRVTPTRVTPTSVTPTSVNSTSVNPTRVQQTNQPTTHGYDTLTTDDVDIDTTHMETNQSVTLSPAIDTLPITTVENETTVSFNPSFETNQLTALQSTLITVSHSLSVVFQR